MKPNPKLKQQGTDQAKPKPKPKPKLKQQEAWLSGALELFKAANLEMTTRRDSLEEGLNKEKFDRLFVVESYEKEREERESVEASLDVLKVDLERVTHEAKRFSEQEEVQIMMLCMSLYHKLFC